MGAVRFLPWLRNRLGTDKWCVAPRLTDRLRDKGYSLTVSQSKYTSLRREWALDHPAVKAIDRLPEDFPYRNWLFELAIRHLEGAETEDRHG